MRRVCFVILSILLISSCAFGGKKPQMVYVEGGTYNWKDIPGIGSEEVTIENLFVQKYEVTRREWEEYLKATGRTKFMELILMQMQYMHVMAYEESAIAGVTFYEALEYCNWRSVKDGYEPVYILSESMEITEYYRDKNGDPLSMPEIGINADANGYRLPTESEWLYFALGGEEGIKSKWWENKKVEEYGWFGTRTSSTKEVGKLSANPLGLYDVFGNVSEWSLGTTKPQREILESDNVIRANGGSLLNRLDGRSIMEFVKDIFLREVYPLSRGYLGIRMVRRA